MFQELVKRYVSDMKPDKFEYSKIYKNCELQDASVFLYGLESKEPSSDKK